MPLLFLRKILTLLSGTVLAQIVSFFLIPIITRYYPMGEIGSAEVFIAAVLTLSIGINAGYEFTIMLPSSPKEAFHLTRTGILIGIFLSGLLFLPALMGYFAFPNTVRQWMPAEWLLLIPFCILAEGIMQVLRTFLNREGKYAEITTGKLLNVALKNGLSVLIGLVSGSGHGLILAFTAGQAGNLYFWVRSARESGFRFYAPPTPLVLALLKKYKDFLKFGTLSSWLGAFSKRIHYFFIPLLFVNASPILGVFVMAEKILMIPLFFSIAAADVFYQKVSEAGNRGTTRRITLNTFYFLLVASIIIYGLLCIPDSRFFSWLLGEEYGKAVVYIRAFSFYTAGLFIVTPLSYLVDVKRTLSTFFVLNLGILVGKIVFLAIGCRNGLEGEMIRWYAIGSGVLIVVQAIYLLRLGIKR